MNARTKILVAVAVAVVAIAAIAAALSMGGGGGNDYGVDGGDDGDGDTPVTPTGTGATVWVYEDDGYVAHEGTGTTVQDVMRDALDDVVFGSNGNVTSYEGVPNGDDGTWVMFRWTSTSGWVVVQPGYEHVEGTQLALEYSQRTVDESGSVTYTIPDKEIEMEVWFFLQFAELEDIASMTGATVREMYADMLHWIELMGLDEQTLIDGFWLSGTGSTSNEALANAVADLILDSHPDLEYTVTETSTYIEYALDGEVLFRHGVRSDMYGWFLVFLGWTDYQMGELYLYWSQYTYSPNASTLDDPNYWGYNQFSFGLYDITEYKYFGLVLQTTGASDDDDAYFIPLPTPASIREGD